MERKLENTGGLRLLKAAIPFPTVLVVAVLVVLLVVGLVASEQGGARLGDLLFLHVDRGLTAERLALFVVFNISLALVGVSYGPMTLVAGFLFGFWGGVVCGVLVDVFAATSCFFVGRYVLRSQCRAWYESQALPQEVQVAMSKFEQREQVSLILFRAIPIPAVLKNYIPPLLDVSFSSYILAVLAEVFVYVPWMVYLGTKSAAFARTYAKEHEGVVLQEDMSVQWPALAASAVVLAVLLNFAAKEFYNPPRDDLEALGAFADGASVLTPLADPLQTKPFLEHQRL
jgi:uncharacterized membrane protein YdjX (TVP38/TMEM64 family)